MANRDDELFAEVGRLLEHRPGWSLQAGSSPGAGPEWCHALGTAVDLAVSVEDNSICVYVMEDDRDVVLADTAELVHWLEANEAASVADPLDVGEAVDDLLHGRIVHWGEPER